LALEETSLGAILSAALVDIPSAHLVHSLLSVRAESSGPFSVAFRAYEHAKFVAVLRGRFKLQLESEPLPTLLRRGDCYALTRGCAYRIYNADVPDSDAAKLFSTFRESDGVVRWGDGTVDTVTVGSRVVFTREGLAWLRHWLPPFVRIPAGTAEARRLRAILTLLHGDPTEALGANFAAERYVGLLLVQVLRHLRARDGATLNPRP
jgi:hypothetical protein